MALLKFIYGKLAAEVQEEAVSIAADIIEKWKQDWLAHYAEPTYFGDILGMQLATLDRMIIEEMIPRYKSERMELDTNIARATRYFHISRPLTYKHASVVELQRHEEAEKVMYAAYDKRNLNEHMLYNIALEVAMEAWDAFVEWRTEQEKKYGINQVNTPGIEG